MRAAVAAAAIRCCYRCWCRRWCRRCCYLLLKAGEMIPEVEGTRSWGPRGKGSPSVSKGAKPSLQLLQLLKNSPREVKRAHFGYILGPPWSHPGNGIYGGPEGRVPPGFSGPVMLLLLLLQVVAFYSSTPNLPQEVDKAVDKSIFLWIFIVGTIMT